jgi:hypothetical protein
MVGLHRISQWCHWTALLFEIVGTCLVFLEVRRILAQLHAAGFASYAGGPPPGYTGRLYDSGPLGFGMLLVAIVLTSVALALGSHAKREISPSESSPAAQAPLAANTTMSAEELQMSISELSEFRASPEAAWVAKVNAAPTEVVAGAILHWFGHTGVTLGPDPEASHREAAQALLQARFSKQVSDATVKLHTSIDAFQQETSDQTAWMLRLTWAIAVLTAIMAVGLAAQIWIAVRSGG